MQRPINYAAGALKEALFAAKTEIKDLIHETESLAKNVDRVQAKLAQAHEREKQLMEALKEHGQES